MDCVFVEQDVWACHPSIDLTWKYNLVISWHKGNVSECELLIVRCNFITAISMKRNVHCKNTAIYQLLHQIHNIMDLNTMCMYSNKKSEQLTIADHCTLIFKVTQGRWLIQSKTYIHDFLLVINWDLRSISHHLQDIVPRSRKPPHAILRPADQGTRLNVVIKLNRQINVL